MPAPLDDGTMSDLRAQFFGKGQLSPDVLLDLAPVLPKSMLPWAIKIANTVPEHGRRARLLVALAARLTGQQRDDVYGQAMQAVRASLDPEPDAGVVSLALMAPHLKGSLLRTALEVALQASLEFARSGALVGLMPYLPRDMQGQALEAVLSMQWEYARAGALAGVAPHVKGKSRSKIEQAAAQLTEEEDRRRVMAALHKRPTTLFVDTQASLDQARAIPDLYWRLQALMALAPYLPEPERRQVYREAFDLAPTIPHEDWHVPAQAALAAMPDVQAAIENDAARQMQSLGEPARSILCQTVLSELDRSTGANLISAGAHDAPHKIPPRYVNSGFAEQATPDTEQAKNMPLASGHSYYFWLDVGRLQPQAIEVTPTLLPVELLPQGAILHVALFSFEGEIEVDEGANVGTLKLGPKGTVTVEHQPIEGRPDRPASKRWGRRLFFPVRTPAHAGTFRMRCNIYYGPHPVEARECDSHGRTRADRRCAARRGRLHTGPLARSDPAGRVTAAPFQLDAQ